MGDQIPRGSELDPRIWQRVLKRVETLPMVVGDVPWRGTIFRNNRMEAGARGLAIRLSHYMLGFPCGDPVELLKDYQGHLENSSAQLPELL